MPYTRRTWQNAPSSATPVTATALNNIEDGVEVAYEAVTGRLAEANLDATFVSLTAAAKNPDLLIVGAITLDGSDQVTSAAVVWPDGTPGTLTITSRHASGAVTAYNITYGSPVTKTFTQPTITRNSNGAATDVPQIVVT